ncbi:hypothetical protein GCM10023225_17670 [Kineococcus glutinatus]|uniref:PemK-like, MazF-like toxin of type II toxin-antitoxin system n=1 Tax=Kineococcus glutinatus TaxID=1070872 RepID=A0ABP9HT68_9ACTN
MGESGAAAVGTHGDDVRVLRWGTPEWATNGSEVEGGWRHWREASVVPLEGDEGDENPCPVRLESIDLAYADGQQTVLSRSAPRIFIGDLAQLSVRESRRLAAALTELCDRAEAAAP